jgi:hypothetical protein
MESRREASETFDSADRIGSGASEYGSFSRALANLYIEFISHGSVGSGSPVLFGMEEESRRYRTLGSEDWPSCHGSVLTGLGALARFHISMDGNMRIGNVFICEFSLFIYFWFIFLHRAGGEWVGCAPSH